MIDNLLVVTDADDSQTLALEKASEIAGVFDSKITVMEFLATDDARATGAGLEEQEKSLSERVQKIFPKDRAYDTEVIVTDEIPLALKKTCQDKSIDLVVKTGHRTESVFYTPLDWHLIRELNCPILISSEKKWRGKSVILATLDVEKDEATQNKLNEDVLKWANLWAKETSNTLKTCYTIPVAQVLEDMDIVSTDTAIVRKGPEAKEKIKALLDSAGLGESEIHVTAGNPEKEIQSYANKSKADLVVLGSVGRKGIQGKLLGNTAEKVLRHLYTDVLIVRP